MSVLKRRMFQAGGEADSPAVNLQAYASNLNDGTKTAKEIFDAVNQYASTYGVSGLSLAEVEEIVEGKETPKVMAASLEFPKPSAVPVPTVDPVGLDNINIRDVDLIGEFDDLTPSLIPPTTKTGLKPNQFSVGGRIFTLTPEYIKDLKNRAAKTQGGLVYDIINSPDFYAGEEARKTLLGFAAVDVPGLLNIYDDQPFPMVDVFGAQVGDRTIEGIESRIGKGMFNEPTDFGALFRNIIRIGKNIGGDAFYNIEAAFAGMPEEMPVPKSRTDMAVDTAEALKEYGLVTETDSIQQELDNLTIDDETKKELPIEEQVEEEDFVETPSAIFDPTQTIDIPFDPTKKEEPKVEERKVAKTYQPLVDPDLALDFLGAVGGKLVETGRVDLGLAGGAADAVTLRRQKEAAEAKARAEGATKTALKATDLKALRDSGQNINLKIQEYEGGRAGIRFVQEALSIFKKARETGEPLGGIPGFMAELGDRVQALFGYDEGPEDQSARTRINKLIEVVRQGNIRDILGESGRTISNLDRDIIKDVFGGIKIDESPDIAITKLEKSLEKLQLANRARQGDIQDEMRFLQSPEFGSRGFDTILSKLSSINSVLADDPFAPYVATAATSYQPIVDIDL
jgi:hypothetical protein